MDNNFLKDLSDRLSRLAPAAEELREEARTKMEQTLKKALGELDVLTAEEFAAQTQALQRAEQRIAELESVVTSLESRLASLEAGEK